MDPGMVQQVLDAVGHGRDGLKWQLYMGLPSGPHPSVPRVHDQGVSAWHERYGEVDYLLVWVWAPEERTARSALDEALQGRERTMLRDAPVHSANVLPDALHLRRKPASCDPST